MKLQEFLKMVDGLNVAEYELCINKNPITDVVIQDTKIVFKTDNALEVYYTHLGKMNNLKEMIDNIKKDNVEVISEIEAVQIAHSLELDFKEVIDEFKQNNINVEVL